MLHNPFRIAIFIEYSQSREWDPPTFNPFILPEIKGLLRLGDTEINLNGSEDNYTLDGSIDNVTLTEGEEIYIELYDADAGDTKESVGSEYIYFNGENIYIDVGDATVSIDFYEQ